MPKKRVICCLRLCSDILRNSRNQKFLKNAEFAENQQNSDFSRADLSPPWINQDKWQIPSDAPWNSEHGHANYIPNDWTELHKNPKYWPKSPDTRRRWGSQNVPADRITSISVSVETISVSQKSPENRNSMINPFSTENYQKIENP